MSRLVALCSSVASLALGIAGPALARAAVYPGCASAPAAPTGTVHYVDPINGSMTGDGTLAHPWHTLTEVVAAGLFYNTPVHGLAHISPSAPIQAGDTVYLLSGNHGSVLLKGSYGKGLVGFNNSSFITIAALPGQTPVLSQLSIVGGSKWVFRGLTLQSTNNTGIFPSGGGSAGDYWLASFQGPHSDIVFDSDTLSSAPDASAWSILDWLTKRASGVREIGGTCVAVTNTSLKYIGFGLATQSSNNVLIQNDSIDYFADDGIDYGSNNVSIIGNRITNSIEDGDGFHRDGMQGQPYTESTLNSNITIQNNTVIRITDPALAFPAYLQGIDEFDGRWSNVNVSNNVVITDAGQGITFYGVNRLAISNNILLGDSGKVLPCSHLTFAQCQTESVIVSTATVPAVYVTASKAGLPSTNVAVTGNIVTGLGVTLSTTPASITNNTCLLTNGKCGISIPVNGAMITAWKPGSYGLGNVISTLTPSQAFVEYDPLAMLYNLTLK
jgi:hypothetical protein